MILALTRETVAAVEIAGVCHVKAEGFNIAGFVFEVKGDVLVDVFAEKFFLLYKLSDVGETEADFLFSNIRPVTVFF